MLKQFMILGVTFFLLTGCVQQEKKTSQNEETKIVDKEQSVTPINKDISFKKAVQRPIDINKKEDSLSTFQPEGLSTENKASYDIELHLNDKRSFSISSTTHVENLSTDTWEDIIFYFIPHSFTEKWKPEFMNDAAKVEIISVTLNNEPADYLLENDTLKLFAKKGIAPSESAEIKVDYTFHVPEQGVRFSYSKGNYYLAQWYPMLATYRSGWVKDDYIVIGESYHTGFSDFKVSYDIPEGYQIISSSDHENIELGSKGTVEMKNSKEFFLALSKDMISSTATVDGIEVRVFADPVQQYNIDSVLNLSVDALQYYNEKLGKYPYKQLDIIMDEGGMEYPGVVTVTNDSAAEHTIVHEIAHQWFYGRVSNNPYYTAWIDEGLTDFASYIYFMDRKGRSVDSLFNIPRQWVKQDKQENKLKLAHLPLHEYKNGGYASANYKVPTLELWEMSGNTENALSYLKTYVDLYSFLEVDAHEWIRYTNTYFQLEDPAILSEWIKVE